MRNLLTIEVDFGDDREGALRMFAHMIGVNRQELYHTEPGFRFSGAAVPNLFTLLRPASVDLRVEEL